MLKNKRGQAAILLAMSLIAIVSLLAVVIDTGRIYVEHTKLQRAVDSAVLAAAQELPPGKNMTEDEIKELIYDALSYNLDTAEITIKKDDNVSDYLLPSDIVKGQVTETKEGFNLRDTLENGTVDIQFLVPADSRDQEKTVVSVTVHKRLDTRLSTILGYNEWTISAQRIARNGPIASVPEFLPIAVVSKVDANNNPIKIPYKRTIRLSNTQHDISNTDPLYEYIPFTSFNGITNPNDAEHKAEHMVKNTTITTSKTANIIETRIRSSADSQTLFEGMCSGIDRRITLHDAGANTIGCLNSDNVIGDDRPHNITSINLSRRFSYGDDPRLVLVPIVQVTNGNYTWLDRRQRVYKVIGFGMFFIQYAHYTSFPPGGEMYSNDAGGGSVAMTEFVGYFTDSILEGPIDPQAYDYGLTGVQYVDPNDEEVFDIHR